MRYDRLRARVEAAIKTAPTGAAIVILNDDGTWTAIYGTPRKEATFPTDGQAILHIKAHTAPATPIIVIDV